MNKCPAQVSQTGPLPSDMGKSSDPIANDFLDTAQKNVGGWLQLYGELVRILRQHDGDGYAGLMLDEIERHGSAHVRHSSSESGHPLARFARHLPSDYLPVLAECLGPQAVFGAYLGTASGWDIVRLPEGSRASSGVDDKTISWKIIEAGTSLGSIEESLAPAMAPGAGGQNVQIPVRKVLEKVEGLLPEMIHIDSLLKGEIYGYWSRTMLERLPVKHRDLADALGCQRTSLSRWQSKKKLKSGMPARIVEKLCSDGKHACSAREDEPFFICRILNPFLKAGGHRLRGRGGQITNSVLATAFWNIEKHRAGLLATLRAATSIRSLGRDQLDVSERDELFVFVNELIYELTKLEYHLRGARVQGPKGQRAL